MDYAIVWVISQFCRYTQERGKSVFFPVRFSFRRDRPVSPAQGILKVEENWISSKFWKTLFHFFFLPFLDSTNCFHFFSKFAVRKLNYKVCGLISCQQNGREKRKWLQVPSGFYEGEWLSSSTIYSIICR